MARDRSKLEAAVRAADQALQHGRDEARYRERAEAQNRDRRAVELIMDFMRKMNESERVRASQAKELLVLKKRIERLERKMQQ